jgi:ribonucleoside-triphosphate reductase
VQSKLNSKQPLSEYAPAEAAETVTICEAPAAEVKTILFATPTCPNCKAAGMFLDKAGVAYDKLMADENPELVALYGVKQAPTLVVISGDEYQTIPNLSNIKAYAEKK